MELLISTLLVYGITNIIVNGSIFDILKKKLKDAAVTRDSYLLEMLYTLVNCPMCSGFWIGAIIGIFLGPFPFWNIIFNGGLYSGTTWIIYCITQFLGQGYDPNRTINVVMQEPVTIKEYKEPKEV